VLPRPVGLPLVVWDEPLYCHVPLDTPFEPDTIAGHGEAGDRWSHPGEPTTYVASDAGVALGELARHQPAGRPQPLARRIVGLYPQQGALRGLVDLRDPAIRRALAIADGATWCFDRRLARQVAAALRSEPRHRGLIVPSLAFPDQPSRCNVVLFADRYPAPFGELLLGWREVVRVEGGSGPNAGPPPTPPC
jgi:RES domain-containing protein